MRNNTQSTSIQGSNDESRMAGVGPALARVAVAPGRSAEAPDWREDRRGKGLIRGGYHRGAPAGFGRPEHSLRVVLPVRTSLIVTAALLVPWVTAPARSAETTYTVVESKSSVRIHVGKAGAFSFAGHQHEVLAPVSGTVTADPADLSASSVDLAFASARLRVLPEGEPTGDAPKVEAIMHGPEVLDAVRFPEVHFRSKKVAGRSVSGGAYELSLVGELSLHGVTQQITVPVKVTLGGRALTATGETILRHDQFGMNPVSAAGGAVKVKNEIRIDFQIVAERP